MAPSSITRISAERSLRYLISLSARWRLRRARTTAGNGRACSSATPSLTGRGRGQRRATRTRAASSERAMKPAHTDTDSGRHRRSSTSYQLEARSRSSPRSRARSSASTSRRLLISARTSGTRRHRGAGSSRCARTHRAARRSDRGRVLRPQSVPFTDPKRFILTAESFNAIGKGGHFAAWEQPELVSEEIRATFRALREPRTTIARCSIPLRPRPVRPERPNEAFGSAPRSHASRSPDPVAP